MTGVRTRRLGARLVAALAFLGARAAAAVDLPADPTAGAVPVAAQDGALFGWIWDHNPDLRDARAQVRVAAAELLRARALPNPGIDLTWGTLPIGQTNPGNLKDAFFNVPNYGIAFRQPFEPAKREPRVRVAQAAIAVAEMAAQAQAQALFFDAMEAVSHVALAQVRAQAFDELVESSRQLQELHRIRNSKGDVAGLDLLRAEAEHSRVVAARAGVDQEIADALAKCSEIVAAPCTPFASQAAAQRWIDGQTSVTVAAAWSDDVENRRLDVQLLAVQAEAARALAAVAKAAAMPDLEARLSYLFDTFTVSGNQQQSISLGLGLLLPVWQAGQTERRAAEAQLQRSDAVRQARVAQTEATLANARRRLDLARERNESLNDSVARAQRVVQGLTEALRRGGTTLSDVLQARQTLSALVLDRMDVQGERLAAALAARRAMGLSPGRLGAGP